MVYLHDNFWLLLTYRLCRPQHSELAADASPAGAPRGDIGDPVLDHVNDSRGGDETDDEEDSHDM